MPFPLGNPFFERSAAGAIAAAATALPRLDAVVFTGGIGENATRIRASIVQRLASIGVPPIDDVPPTNTVVAGGYFTQIGGQPRNDLAALDATSGLATAWDPNPRFPFSTSGVFALAADRGASRVALAAVMGRVARTASSADAYSCMSRRDRLCLLRQHPVGKEPRRRWMRRPVKGQQCAGEREVGVR